MKSEKELCYDYDIFTSQTQIDTTLSTKIKFQVKEKNDKYGVQPRLFIIYTDTSFAITWYDDGTYTTKSIDFTPEGDQIYFHGKDLVCKTHSCRSIILTDAKDFIDKFFKDKSGLCKESIEKIKVISK